MNVCEHGDHPAPEGQRFCSMACQKCESDPRSADGCARICWAATLLVGEDNPYTPGEAGRDFALYPHPRGASGNRLRRIMGLTDNEYLSFTRTNLCAGKWSAPRAREFARALAGSAFTTLVLCGAKVRRSFVLEDADTPPPLVTVMSATADELPITVVCLPHPSGRSRAWDERDMVGRCRADLRQAMPWVPWGSAADALPGFRR